MRLTAPAIRTAKSTDKTKRMYDTGGLSLEVAPAGGKGWRLKYRFAGKEKRLALGVYPDISLQAARKRRDEARSLLANGPLTRAKTRRLRGQPGGRAPGSTSPRHRPR
jgi:hypothetical protein